MSDKTSALSILLGQELEKQALERKIDQQAEEIQRLSDELTKWRKGLNSISYDTKDAEIQRLTEAKITTYMKIQCMGEFSWKEDAPYYNEDGNIVEHEATREVPWDLCKEIYKAMHKARIEEPPRDTGA